MHCQFFAYAFFTAFTGDNVGYFETQSKNVFLSMDLTMTDCFLTHMSETMFDFHFYRVDSMTWIRGIQFY